jgi:hypothetical protein
MGKEKKNFKIQFNKFETTPSQKEKKKLLISVDTPPVPAPRVHILSANSLFIRAHSRMTSS